MTELNTNGATDSSPSISKYIKAGLIAGSVSAILNNLIYIIMIIVGGYDWVSIIAISILIASFLPNLVASIAYFKLSRVTHRARLNLTIGIIAFVLISVLPHLGIGPAPTPAMEALPEGFDLVTVPIHMVFGLTAISLMPWLVTRD